MRVGEVEYIVCKALNNLQKVHAFDAEKLGYHINAKDPNEPKVYLWGNWRETEEILLMLQNIPVTRSLSDNIIKILAEVQTVHGLPILSPSNIEKVNNEIEHLLSLLQDLKDTYGEANYNDNPVGFDVKLPPNISFSDFVKCIKDLDTAFSQCPGLKSDTENIQFSGVDVGSTWLAFAIIGAAAVSYILKNLAAIIDHIVIIRSHKITCKQQEEMARRYGLSNDYLHKLIDSHNDFLKKLEENALNELCESDNITDPEEKQRYHHSFDLLCKWMDKGMQIHAAIGSSEESKALFPTLETQTLPESVTKLLEEAKNMKNE